MSGLEASLLLIGVALVVLPLVLALIVLVIYGLDRLTNWV
jgi:hypothetical protein